MSFSNSYQNLDPLLWKEKAPESIHQYQIQLFVGVCADRACVRAFALLMGRSGDIRKIYFTQPTGTTSPSEVILCDLSDVDDMG